MNYWQVVPRNLLNNKIDALVLPVPSKVNEFCRDITAEPVILCIYEYIAFCNFLQSTYNHTLL